MFINNNDSLANRKIHLLKKKHRFYLAANSFASKCTQRDFIIKVDFTC